MLYRTVGKNIQYWADQTSQGRTKISCTGVTSPTNQPMKYVPLVSVSKVSRGHPSLVPRVPYSRGRIPSGTYHYRVPDTGILYCTLTSCTVAWWGPWYTGGGYRYHPVLDRQVWSVLYRTFTSCTVAWYPGGRIPSGRYWILLLCRTFTSCTVVWYPGGRIPSGTGYYFYAVPSHHALWPGIQEEGYHQVLDTLAPSLFRQLRTMPARLQYPLARVPYV